MFDYLTLEMAQSLTAEAKARLHQQEIVSAIQNAAIGGAESVMVSHITDEEVSQTLEAGFTVFPLSGGKAEISWHKKSAGAGDTDVE